MVALNEATGKPGMSPISVLLNLLWIIFGGLWMAAGWMIAALIMAITIIGLPWTRAAFNIGLYTLLPSAREPSPALSMVSTTWVRDHLVFWATSYG
jgi:uncharacterized membrane protein YccF (DUF307 family)